MRPPAGRGRRASPPRRRSSSRPRRSRRPREARARGPSQKSLAAVAAEARALEAAAARRASRARPRPRTCSAHERMDGERVQLRRAERDDARHEVRPPRRRAPWRGRRRGSGRSIAAAAALLGDELLERAPRAARRAAAGAVDVGQHPGLARWWPVRRSQCAIRPSEPSPARKPGIRSTGCPRPSCTPRRGRSGRAAARQPPGRSRLPPERRSWQRVTDPRSAHLAAVPAYPRYRARTVGDPIRASAGLGGQLACPPMRAVTDRTTASLVVEERPDPEPGQGELLVAGARRGPQRRGHAAAQGRLSGAARLAAGHPRPRAGRRGGGAGPGRDALRARATG